MMILHICSLWSNAPKIDGSSSTNNCIDRRPVRTKLFETKTEFRTQDTINNLQNIGLSDKPTPLMSLPTPKPKPSTPKKENELKDEKTRMFKLLYKKANEKEVSVKEIETEEDDNKYASYNVLSDDSILVITADESDALAAVNKVTTYALFAIVGSVILFAIINRLQSLDI